MLIEIDRAASPFQLAHGWWSGRYWRAIVADTDSETKSRGVYIQVLIPTRVFARGSEYAATVPAKYHRDTVLVHGAYYVAMLDGGMPEGWNWRWVEVYYGSQYIAKTSDKWVSAEVQVSWYPRRPAKSATYVAVRPETFLQHIQPAARYLCEQFVIIETTHTYVDTMTPEDDTEPRGGPGDH